MNLSEGNDTITATNVPVNLRQDISLGVSCSNGLAAGSLALARGDRYRNADAETLENYGKIMKPGTVK